MSFENHHNLFRHVIITQRDRQCPELPALRCFTPNSADDYKLSVDWDQLTTPEESLARLGGSYKSGKTEFKAFELWEVYSLNVGKVRNVNLVKDILHDPIIHEVVKKGKPNNESHSLIMIDRDPENEPETYIALRRAAEKVSVNMETVKSAVKILREVSE